MKRHTDRPLEETFVYTALDESCPDCGRRLPIYQVISRSVECVERAVLLKRRDKRCGPDCPGERPVFFAPRDLRVVLPNRIYGLDVTLNVGERHLDDGVALAQITRDLNARGVPVDQRHTCRVFRDFVALTELVRGDEAAVQKRLLAQGGMVLMCDGVQFEDRSPVLYLVWDAISGTPLFGERKPFRGADDLVPLLERVRAMGVPVLGVVSDKEKGLVPAVQRVFPDVPYQFCHTHFLKNCAKPLDADRTSLQGSVRRRTDAVRKVSAGLPRSPSPGSEAAPAEEEVAPVVDETAPPAASTEPTTMTAATQHDDSPRTADPSALTEEELAPVVDETAPPAASTEPPTMTAATQHDDSPRTADPSALTEEELAPVVDETAPPAASTEPPTLTEEELAREVCELVRVNSRVSGKAPLDPAELKRHERLDDIRALVDGARKKKPGRPRTAAVGPCSKS